MGAFGDDDPVDVVEIGKASLPMGSFTAVKILGCLSMIDDGELDWKMIAISAEDEFADKINDVDDIEEYYPGTVSGGTRRLMTSQSTALVTVRRRLALPRPRRSSRRPTASTRICSPVRPKRASSGCPKQQLFAESFVPLH